MLGSIVLCTISCVFDYSQEVRMMKQAVENENEQFASHRPPVVFELLKSSSPNTCQSDTKQLQSEWSLLIEIQLQSDNQDVLIETPIHRSTLILVDSAVNPPSLVTPLLHGQKG